MAAEIVFVSDQLGAGVEWSTTTGFSDEESIHFCGASSEKLRELFARGSGAVPPVLSRLRAGRRAPSCDDAALSGRRHADLPRVPPRRFHDLPPQFSVTPSIYLEHDCKRPPRSDDEFDRRSRRDHGRAEDLLSVIRGCSLRLRVLFAISRGPSSSPSTSR